MNPDEHDGHVDGGMTHDLPRLLSRRRALALLGGGTLGLLAACSGGTQRTAAGGTPPEARVAPLGGIPPEARGPFPADGDNGPNVLAESGIVRRDIRASIGDARGTADGLPLTIRLRVLTASGGSPLVGAAVYLWQCDRHGDYSLYSAAAADQNYLRGVQVAEPDGQVEFLSVFPGAYPGRWPHLHLEVYQRLAEAVSSGRALRTTQLALPQDACAQAYEAPGYEQSVRELARVSLDSDVAFADGYGRQLLRTSGGNAEGWTAELDVAVPV